MKISTKLTGKLKLAALRGTITLAGVVRSQAVTYTWVPNAGPATGLLVLAAADSTPGFHSAVPLSAVFDGDGPGAGPALSPIIGFYPGLPTALFFGFTVHSDGILQESLNFWAGGTLFESHFAEAGESTTTATGLGYWKPVVDEPRHTPDGGSMGLLLATALGSLRVVYGLKAGKS